eukprot:TRINITY_DN6803_c0_g2_i1.p1 TRINITY_DN6803_c0_g2~~TRINITY_DN6803_c0_g2_i1.p1  ORF type:complete len:202 (+),score=41.87 TRINITY_DN6803_c0_g2_i1:69-674(+)
MDRRHNDAQSIPIVLENPDGSLMSGIPRKNYQSINYEETPNVSETTTQATPLLTHQTMRAFEINLLYHRNRTLFLVLLSMEVLSNIAFIASGIIQSDEAIDTLEEEVGGIEKSAIVPLYWVAMSLYILYCIALYHSGFLGIYRRNIPLLSRFIQLSLFGLFLLIAFAYMNRLSFLLFFLRLTEYVYARYIRKMLQTFGIWQ